MTGRWNKNWYITIHVHVKTQIHEPVENWFITDDMEGLDGVLNKGGLHNWVSIRKKSRLDSLLYSVCTNRFRCFWLTTPMDCSPRQASLSMGSLSKNTGVGSVSSSEGLSLTGMEQAFLLSTVWQVVSLPTSHLGLDLTWYTKSISAKFEKKL